MKEFTIGWVLAMAATAAAAGSGGAPCPGGRFLLGGSSARAIGAGDREAVVVTPASLATSASVAIGATCPATPATLRARGRVTKLRASWRHGCDGSGGRVMLRGIIDGATCTQLAGTIHGHALRPRRRAFAATLTRCGDGTVDADAGETCDPPDGTTCRSDCQVGRTCGSGAPDASGECGATAAPIEVYPTCASLTDDLYVIGLFFSYYNTGGATVHVPQICDIGTRVLALPRIHYHCDGTGGFRATSGFVGTSLVNDVLNGANGGVTEASISECLFDTNGRSGVAAIELGVKTASQTGHVPPRRVWIEDNVFRGGNQAMLARIDAAGSSEVFLRGNTFVGSNVDATNDGGLEMSCGSSCLGGCLTDTGCVVADTEFRQLGGTGLWVHSASGVPSAEVTVSNLTFVEVHGESILNDVGLGGANVSVHGVFAGTNRRSLVRLNGPTSITNLGVTGLTAKNLIESTSPVLSLRGGGVTGSGATGIFTGTAASQSTTTLIKETSAVSWNGDEWKDYEVVLSGCSQAGVRRWVSTNSQDTLTIAPALAAEPDGCAYQLTGSGMVVVRGAVTATIEDFVWDNAPQTAENTLQVTDQLVLRDVWAATVAGNLFSLAHRVGHAAVRLVTTGAGPISNAGGNSGPIIIRENFVLKQCQQSQGCPAYGCFAFDRQSTATTFQDVLFLGNDIGATHDCTAITGAQSSWYTRSGNVGF